MTYADQDRNEDVTLSALPSRQQLSGRDFAILYECRETAIRGRIDEGYRGASAAAVSNSAPLFSGLLAQGTQGRGRE
jgi:hypothetical protein